jgi:hypothetical protein
MSRAPHIEDDALALVALPIADAQRTAAYAHARACEPCRRALRRAATLLGHVDALADERPPAPAVLLAIARPVVAELSALVVPGGLIAGVLVASWGVLVSLARHRAAGVPAWLTSVVGLGAALACALLVRRARTAATVAAVGSSLLMIACAWTEPGALSAAGLHCLLTEVAGALLPFALVARLGLRRRTLDLRAPMVAVAGAGALAAQAALHLTCPGRGAGLHLLVFHLGGLAAALAAAGVVSRRPRERAAW